MQSWHCTQFHLRSFLILFPRQQLNLRNGLFPYLSRLKFATGIHLLLPHACYKPTPRCFWFYLLNPFKPNCKYMCQLLEKSVTLYLYFWVCLILCLNTINQLIFVMLKCGVLFEVRIGLLNIIQRSFCFKGFIIIG
jgi:hypothetical protein